MDIFGGINDVLFEYEIRSIWILLKGMTDFEFRGIKDANTEIKPRFTFYVFFFSLYKRPAMTFIEKNGKRHPQGFR